ncbi:MAG: GMC family oxidoreductase N-terminal domain-containing protein [Arenicellales bacterium]
MLAETFDYIVVGAGSAGCVVASHLARDRNHKVCVLEAGPMDRNPYIHIPAGFVKTVHDPRINWLYQTEPGEWTGGRRISQPRGKVVGGSGAINGHVFNRGQACDFDGWLKRGEHRVGLH